MDVDKLRQTLTGLTGSTKAAKLRQLMPEIEEKVHQGVRHEEIVAALKDGGLDVGLEAFRKTLYRYRRQQRQAVGDKPQAATGPIRADGNPPARSKPAVQLDAEPDDDEDAAMPSFEDALDRTKRDKASDAYLGRSRPIIGKKKS